MKDDTEILLSDRKIKLFIKSNKSLVDNNNTNIEQVINRLTIENDHKILQK